MTSPHPNRSQPWALLALVAVLVLSVAVATAWLVGDQSETDFRTPEGPVYSCEALERSGGNGCDYLFQPLRLSAGAERAVGVAASVVAATSLAALVVRRRQRTGARVPRSVVIKLLVAAVLTGWGYRIFTLGASGANIGAGLFLMSAAPAILFLVASSCWQLWLWRRRTAASS